MFSLPQSTEVRRQIAKKLLYTKFAAELSGNKKKQFESEISKIVIQNEISPVSVNIKEGEKVKAIFLVEIDLKQKNYSERNLILISKLFGQHLILALKYGNEYQLAIYQQRLLCSDWKQEEQHTLTLVGLSLDTVWESFVCQISGIIVETGNTLDEQISLEEQKQKIRKKIDTLETKARNEIQSKKKFEIFQKIKAFEKELEEM